VHDTALLAHELLCVHLRCFYGVDTGLPSKKISARSATAKKKSTLMRRRKLRNLRFPKA
jgi:hypothetical protein